MTARECVPLFTTLATIKAHDPCKGGWKTLLAHVGKRQADDAPLALTTILDSNGLDDALWALRAVDGHDGPIRLLAVWCARQVQHLLTDPRSLTALDVAERFAHGTATAAELAEAHAEAWDASLDSERTSERALELAAARAVERASSQYAVQYAVQDAARAVAHASAWDPSRDASWAASWAASAWGMARNAARDAAWAAWAREFRRRFAPQVADTVRKAMESTP